MFYFVTLCDRPIYNVSMSRDYSSSHPAVLKSIDLHYYLLPTIVKITIKL